MFLGAPPFSEKLFLFLSTHKLLTMIYLASNSPRRKELLAGLDIDFETWVIPDIDESFPENLHPEETAEFLAMKKAAPYFVGENLLRLAEDDIVVTADTVVILEERVLGKPADEAEAREMLRALSGKTHEVITGVCLTSKSKQRHFSVTTKVTFAKLSEKQISYYIEKYQPFDKAGAYGIQEWIGYVGVTRLEGSYFNVMGLPVQRIYEEICRF